MHAVTALSLLALAGSTIAAPYGHGKPHVVYTTEIYTVIVTGGAPPATYQPAPEPTTEVVYTTKAPKPTTVKAKPTTTAVPSQPAYTQEPEKPSTTAAPAPSATGYMATVNEWRAKLGLKDLAHDDTLESNAEDTCRSGNGQMVHKLNPGTMGQVLAPGQSNEFERVFVGGWLCEKPDMAGMDGVCASMSSGWNYMGQTGHADILTSGSYSKIGCACVQGIWGCDLA
ncbi:hypothetical protein K458DRAFT_414571 [Lentithecium fluviatile CBS 122367]|uniref:SCP domain-containing protein n=1 Tax=Lentithecium fluviatile CBS 122367 TaxID=1168545 RepID=A0A6G1JE80_9PLEO|nr:hypothetical protein K458DRAFT_414571 [Lentithecium fluviatile CBS 122367]